MSLAHHHMINLFISSYRGAIVINLGSKSNSVIEVDRVLLHWVVVMSLPLDHVTLINLYISRYSEATGAMFIHAIA